MKDYHNIALHNYHNLPHENHIFLWCDITRLKDTTEDIKNEVIRMKKKAQLEMRNNIPEEIKKREEKKIMVELIERKREEAGRARRGKREFINEGHNRNLERNRNQNVSKNRCMDRTNGKS